MGHDILDPVKSSAADILLIDDDQDIRMALGDALEHEGYSVLGVSLGEEAVQRVRQAQYGVALLDIMLPDLDGQAVLKQLMEIDPELPVIVFTAHPTQDNTVGSMTRGAFAYITKPYDLDHLKATIRRATSLRTLSVKIGKTTLALSESEERFRSVVESATDAIILANQDGRIVSWNKAAQRMFQYTDEEILEQPLTHLMPHRYRHNHEQALARFTSGHQTGVRSEPLEFHGLKKDGTEFPLELSLGTWTTSTGSFFSGIIRDITARKRAEHRLGIQYTVSQILADSPALKDATPKILEAICSSLGWEFGAIWNIDDTSQVLRCHEAWHAGLLHRIPESQRSWTSAPHTLDVQSPDFVNLSEFAAFSGQTTFVLGVGLPGRVWASGKPAWISDVVQDPNFPRAPIAAKLGLHGAFGFPIQSGTELLGVMEFFSRVFQYPDNELLQMFSAIGSQIGQFIVRKRAEESLQESQARFQEMADHIHDVFWMTNVEKTRMEYVSPGYEKIWGRSRRSLYADPQSWLEAIHPDDRDAVRTAALTKQTTGEYDEEYRILRPDGMVRWIQDRAFPVQNETGEVFRITGIAEDITERKQAQVALRLAYQKLDTILASLPCAVMILNDDHQVIHANAIAYQQFCPSCEVLAGKRISDILPIPATDPKHKDDQMGKDHPDFEFTVDHSVFRYRFFPVAIPGSHRPHRGIVIWDITEQKQLQDQLIQTEKLASLGTLVSGMAHEINNPLQGILGMAEIILEESDLPTIKEYTQDILGYARHVATVVQDFACYARQSGRDGAVQCHIPDRLSSAVKLIKRNPQFGHIEVMTMFEEVPPVWARRAELDQVFVNLVSNAVQAMNGKGTLTLETYLKDGSVTAVIRDTGQGIPKSVLCKIFDPFFTTKEPGKGTGLGLSIVHKIIGKYGGTVTVESQEGKGSTFWVRFPCEHPSL